MTQPKLAVQIEKAPLECYVLDRIGLPVISSIVIQNCSDAPISGLTIAVSSDAGLVEPYQSVIEQIDAGASVELEPDLRLSSAALIQVSESFRETIRVTASTTSIAANEAASAAKATDATTAGEKSVLSQTDFPMEILPYDQWPAAVSHESIACFVTPNHTGINHVLLAASKILSKWTGNGSLEGYQSGSTDRVRKIAGAIFEAIRAEGIVYINPPASFARLGQRVRLAGDVLSQHMGTCIDLAALYCSCLEAAGLNPFIVTIEGHAFAGAWLEDRTFPEIVVEDPSQIVNRCREGVGQMFVVECTLLCNDKKATFDQACQSGEKNLLFEGEFIAGIDIVRAHHGGLTPIPTRVMGDNGWELEAPTVADHQVVAPEARTTSNAFVDATTEGTLTKRDMWERSLLDLSLRNNLLNMRVGSRLLPLAAPNLDDLEDALASGTALALSPRPKEWRDLEPALELVNAIGQYEAFLRDEFKSKRVRTFGTQKELSAAVTSLYRASRVSLDETGANTLYVALGALRWFRDGDPGPHYAPLLLVPVDIVRKSAKQGFALVVRDEEPQLNISLLEMLRRDHGIDIGGLDPLPMDEHGVDTRLVFNTFKQKTLNQKQWEVLEVSCLGIFSFSQFIMWDDIHSHESELRRSVIVSSLLDGHLTWDAEPMTLPDQVEREDALIAVDADASQLFAIKEAARDKSFVLHGPPGTGKSQVITGIIANALAHDKRVLFVAEKAAALEVVQRRLESLGIGKFCLELHSNKVNKSHVLDQLQQASEVRAAGTSDAYRAQLQTVKDLQHDLDAYADALAEKNEAGLSLREQICRFEEAQAACPASGMRMGGDYVAALAGRSQLEDDQRSIGLLVAATQEIGDPSVHPLRAFHGAAYHSELRFVLPGAIGALRSAIHSCQQAVDDLQTQLDIEPPRTAAAWAHLDQTVMGALDLPSLPAVWLAQSRMDALLYDIEYVAEEKRALDAFVASQSATWTPSFFELTSDELDREWTEAHNAGLFRRGRAMQNLVGHIGSYSVTPFAEAQIPRAIALLRDHESRARQLAGHLANIEPFVADFARPAGIDWDALLQAVASAKSVDASATSHEARMLNRHFAASPAARIACEKYRDARDAAATATEALRDLVGARDVTPGESWADASLAALDALESHMDLLPGWMRWRSLAKDVEDRGLACVVDYLMTGSDPALALPTFKTALYQLMCMRSIGQHKDISTFSGQLFEERIRQFTEADHQLLELSRRELQLHLASRVPDLTLASRQGAEAFALSRAIKSKGRGTSIRTLFSQIPNLLARLVPCMLMSPLSVAQYLDFANEPFDLVVFDEASQLQTCKAIGALARAKNAVIVGDPKQMPPTSFFQNRMNDDEYADIADLESILDDCLAINMPQTHLEWHYRSRHESLISFSNRQFYGGELCTFPSSDDSVSRVSLVHVPGHYEGSGLNSFEARAIVAELRRRYADSTAGGTSGEDSPSLGVITFNVKQQNLIEDLLEEEYLKDAGFEKWALSGTEPLFVKNLENVQGDERDVILFSVTYAPDENGKMAMRFGPVNSEGGWRRLNVALTRSRSAMVVFSTLTPDQIDLARTASKGVRALKNFLEFARKGTFIASAHGDGRSDDYIAQALSQRLEAAGFTPTRNVGNSSFKVDIALSTSDYSGYFAGILLDGSSYDTARNSRDREAARETALKGLGWNLARVWAIDWWSDPDSVMRRLTAFLHEAQGTYAEKYPERAVAAAPQPAPEPASEPVPAPESTPESESAPVAPLPQAETHDAADLLPRSEAEVAPTTSKPLMSAELEPLAMPEPATSDDSAQVRAVPYTPISFPGSPTLAPDEYQKDHDAEVIERYQQIIDAEAPIERDRLHAMVRESFGISRRGKLIQAKSDEMLKKVKHSEIKRGEQAFVWKRRDDIKAFRICRIPAEGVALPGLDSLCDEELINLLVLTLQEGGPLAREDLVRAAATRYGFKRLTPKNQDALLAAVTKGKRRKQIIEEDGLIKICS